MPRPTPSLELSEDHHKQLDRWLGALGTPQQVALRCRIILGIAAGKTEVIVASENGVNRKTIRLWRERFLTQGLQGLLGDRSRSGKESHLRFVARQGCDRCHLAVQTER